MFSRLSLALVTLALASTAHADVTENGDLNLIDDPANPSDGLGFFDMSYSDGLSEADALAAAQLVHADARLATPAEWDALFAAAGVVYNGSLTAADAFQTGTAERIITPGDAGASDLATKLGATSGSSTYLWSGTDGSSDFASTRDYILLSDSGWADIRQDSRVAPLSFVGWLIVTEAFMVPNDNECIGEGTGNTCSADAICTDTVQGYECDCDVGYSGDGFTCIDDNECRDEGLGNNCAVGALCTNTPGAFTCDCAPGYTGSGTACIPDNVNQTLTFSFEGTIVDIEDFTGAFNPTEFSVGSAVSGSYTFDALHPDNNGRPDGGYYQGAISGWTLSVGSWAGTATNGQIYAFDDWTPGRDNYSAETGGATVTGPNVSGFEPSSIDLDIVDPTGLGFSNDALPYLTPFLTVFNEAYADPFIGGDVMVEFCEFNTFFDCARVAVDLVSLTSDAELDGIDDHLDNCPIYDNPGQADADLDGIGDVCDIEPTLVISGTCPGVMTFDFSGFTPNGEVELGAAQSTGNTGIRGNGRPCVGVDTGLSSDVRVRTDFVTDAAGNHTFTRNFRAPGSCGFYVRAIDLVTCSTTPSPQIITP